MTIRETARHWQQSKYGDINVFISSLEEEQSKADAGKNSNLSRSEIQRRLAKAYEYRASMLCQKARVDWQLKGERNTSFFHKAIAKRKRSNTINSIRSGESLISRPQEIKKVFLEYFKSLLAPVCYKKIFMLPQNFFSVIPQSFKGSLSELFTLKEITHALEATSATKAPGPDGMNAGVLRKLWPTISGEVLKFFNDFYDHRPIPKGYNSSFIALIPKVNDPKSPAEFRPISLMNAVLKLLMKVLSRRLNKVLPLLISPSQSAFIKGRQISDGIVIANEVVLALQERRANGVVIKIDFEKAFDRVRWEYIYEVMSNMGFDSKWILWIKELFQSSRISVLINGSPSDEFSPTRGLRQGDPLSPLLFNLVGETLTILLQKAVKENLIHGIKLSNSASPITHLQYADDVILFLDDSENSILGIKKVLQCFQILSGFKINFNKSHLFGFNHQKQQLDYWASLLGCNVAEAPIKYLGAVLGSNPRLVRFWDPLLEKIKRKVHSYSADKVSLAGRLVLLKAAIDSVPIFWFNLYNIPVTVEKKWSSIVGIFCGVRRTLGVICISLAGIKSVLRRTRVDWGSFQFALKILSFWPNGYGEHRMKEV